MREDRFSSPILLDKKGRLWLQTPSGSSAINEEGKLVENEPRRLLYEDKQGGLWFQERTDDGERLIRHRESHKLVIIGTSHATTSVTEAQDGTFWFASSHQLAHVAIEGENIRLLGSIPVSNISKPKVVCDSKGYVWVGSSVSSGSSNQRIQVFPPSVALPY